VIARNLFKGLVLVLSAWFLAACSQGIAPGSTQISVDINKDGCQPLSWRVPAGEEITLKVSNQADKDYSWTLTGRPVTLPLDENDTANIFFETQAAAGQDETVKFTAPNAPGDYDVVCSPRVHTEEDQVGRVTVVRP
jgi:plastocyanin